MLDRPPSSGVPNPRTASFINKERTNVRLNPEIKQQAKKRAKDLNLGLNEYVEKLIRKDIGT